jgi:hypothetical protein
LKPQTLTVKQKDAIEIVNKMTLLEQKRMMMEPRQTGAVTGAVTGAIV